MRWSKYKPDVSVRLFAYLYLAAFAVGAYAMNQIWKIELFREHVSVYGILEQYQIQKTDLKKYIVFLFQEKGIFILGCMIAGMAGAGEIFAVLAALWLGVLAGGLATLFLLQSGMRGFLLCMTGIVSQLLFYIPAVIMFLLLMGNYIQRLPGYSFISGKEVKDSIGMCLVFLIIMGIGLVAESYVNSYFWVKIFF